EALGQRVPREGGALYAYGKLHHALQGLEVAQLDLGLGGGGLVVVGPVEALLVDRHHALEGPDESPDLVEGLALDGGRHHRCRRLADRAALAGDADVADGAVVADLEVDDDLVAAEGVEALDPSGGRHRQLTSVPGAAVVVEDDLSVEVFES